MLGGGAIVIDARLLTKALSDPAYVQGLAPRHWDALIAMARAERLDGTLAWRLDGLILPTTVQDVLDQARANAEASRASALWEAEMARRALALLGLPVLLLKGTAFAAAGLAAGQGRLIGDLDILVPRDRISEVEEALRATGWEWVKDDAYDQSYYRDHMHELPPLIHRDRDRIIDVHHTILPLTARITPDAQALIDNAQDMGGGLAMLSPLDMIIHAVAHLFADGDLAGGLRNLWDIDRLVREFGSESGFGDALLAQAQRHQLPKSTARALRLGHHLFGTPVIAEWAMTPRRGDVFYIGRLLARDAWGRETRKILRFAFYVRSHWIRMPPIRLARHLFTKWRKTKNPASD
jgi:Uncharacterised nucleotidyltransferase